MLTGRRFRIEHSSLALDILDGSRAEVTIPTGAIVKVVSGPLRSDRMVDVLWDGRTLVMFALDVDVQGTEILDPKGAQA